MRPGHLPACALLAGALSACALSACALLALLTSYTSNVSASDFTIIGLPDTQYYMAGKHGGKPEFLEAQIRWIAERRDSLNIVYVSHFGDCVEHGDRKEREWRRADRAFRILEDSVATGLADGIPYGIALGNHDQSPRGEADGATTVLYNRTFGAGRFAGRACYGGYYGDNYDNHFELFSAGSLDFIVLSLEFDPTPDSSVLAWADSLLEAHRDRRAILVTHFIIGTDGHRGDQGGLVFEALKENPNLFLMLCGHVSGEARREDVVSEDGQGHRIHTLLADYQNRDNGGDGWLRIMTFSPANNQIRVRTYSPPLDRFETDADSQFTLPYDMQIAPGE